MPGAAFEASLLAERLLHNDLEAPARSLCPAIGDALAAVRSAGAVRAMVSGSGPDGRRPVHRGGRPAHARAAAATLPSATRARSPPSPSAAPTRRRDR